MYFLVILGQLLIVFVQLTLSLLLGIMTLSKPLPEEEHSKFLIPIPILRQMVFSILIISGFIQEFGTLVTFS